MLILHSYLGHNRGYGEKMIRLRRELYSARLAVLVAFAFSLNTLFPLAAQANQSFVSCVKSSGEVRVIASTKKCAKNEKRTKITIAKDLIASFTGPTGAQGPAGVPGPEGPKGETGATGPMGEKGATGPIGQTGLTGAAGVKGASVLTGVGAPPNSLGENGDTYIDKNNATIYGPKTNGVWGYGIGFAGPAGGQGPAGPQGATGPQGPTGATGIGLMNDLPSNFQQLFAIDELGSGCCDLGNKNLKILVKFRNSSEYTISGRDRTHTTLTYTSQVWLHFYDANGNLLYGPGANSAFMPEFHNVYTSWNGGVNWLKGDEKEWEIELENLYVNKPAQAKYVSIVFRFLNLLIVNTLTSPYTFIESFGSRIDGKFAQISSFTVTPFTT